MPFGFRDRLSAVAACILIAVPTAATMAQFETSPGRHSHSGRTAATARVAIGREEQAARQLLYEARRAMLAGDVAAARHAATRAAALPVVWGAEEQSPEQFLAQLDGEPASNRPPAPSAVSTVGGTRRIGGTSPLDREVHFAAQPPRGVNETLPRSGSARRETEASAIEPIAATVAAEDAATPITSEVVPVVFEQIDAETKTEDSTERVEPAGGAATVGTPPAKSSVTTVSEGLRHLWYEDRPADRQTTPQSTPAPAPTPDPIANAAPESVRNRALQTAAHTVPDNLPRSRGFETPIVEPRPAADAVSKAGTKTKHDPPPRVLPPSARAAQRRQQQADDAPPRGLFRAGSILRAVFRRPAQEDQPETAIKQTEHRVEAAPRPMRAEPDRPRYPLPR